MFDLNQSSTLDTRWHCIDHWCVCWYTLNNHLFGTGNQFVVAFAATIVYSTMGIGQSKELDTSQLKSFWDVIAINHEPINTFVGTFHINSLSLSMYPKLYVDLFFNFRNLVSRISLVSFLISYSTYYSINGGIQFVTSPQDCSLWSNYNPLILNHHPIVVLFNYIRCDSLRLSYR